MRRGVLAAAALLVAAACATGDSDVATRTVLVDYAHDELSTSMIDYFPQTVTVHAGDTVRFKQLWTGEPHTVTFGTSINDALGRMRRRLARTPRPALTELAEDRAVLAALPAILGGAAGPFVVNQNGAQPCYLDSGLPPPDPGRACPRRAQPEFTGRESYYSSGFIPHTGKGANRFDVRLADDIEPGQYHFYCTLHGPGQSGTVVVAPDDEPIPSQTDVDHAARTAIDRDFAEALRAGLDQAEGGTLRIAGNAYPQPLAGVNIDAIRSWTGVAHQGHLEHRHGGVNQFVPATVKARVGELVTWTFTGRHTVSFNVPRYFPIFSVAPAGRVTINPRSHRPVGFPGRPADLPNDQRATVDAGTWDGRGFRSSGLDWQAGDRFSLTFSRPGTYLLACLVHPEMVGKVHVDP